MLGVLTLFGPISMDLYLPVLPALADDLAAPTSWAQASVTACLVGLGVGQPIAGPLSDRFGRRVVVLAAVPLYVAASALCATSESIGVFVAARLVQGMTGAAGLVVAQAAGRDAYHGPALVRYYGRLTVLAGAGAIVAPVVGGQLAAIASWRAIFWLLAALGAVILVAVILALPETLHPGPRSRGAVRTASAGTARVLTHPTVLHMAAVAALSNGAVFAYLGGATFVLQDEYDLSAQSYSYAFAVNSAGYLVFGLAGARAATRQGDLRTIVQGVSLATAGAAGVTVAGAMSADLSIVLACLFAILSGVAFATPSATAVALRPFPAAAGSVAAVLGVARYGAGGLAAPLVGIGGATSASSLGAVAAVALGAALVAVVSWTRSHHDR